MWTICRRTNATLYWVGLWMLVMHSVAAGQAAEVVARVPPTMWAATGDDPPCQLQVYIGRINTTTDAASCRQLCASAVSSTFRGRLRMYSREEGGVWQEGAVPWARWEESVDRPGCAVFKNWSHNRYREAKVVAEGSR